MVYDPQDLSRTTVQRFINTTELPTLERIAYSSNKWIDWNIPNYTLGKNTFTVKCGNSSHAIDIYVIEDEERNLNILTSDLYLNLTASGRNNSENENMRQSWTYNRSNGTSTNAAFNGFNWYNNGWITDTEISDSVLRVSNGAAIEIPMSIMNSEALEKGLTFEIQFKLRNVQNYNTLISTSSDEIKDADGNVVDIKVTKRVESTDGVWCSYYGNDIGFCLGTQEGFFKSK
jgi:hypothetical protein